MMTSLPHSEDFHVGMTIMPIVMLSAISYARQGRKKKNKIERPAHFRWWSVILHIFAEFIVFV